MVPEPDERVLSDPFFAGTLNGLSTSLADSDVQVVLVIARPGESERTVRYLRNGHVDGAIVVSHHRNDELDRALQASRVPNVFVGRPLSADDRGVQYVDTDNVEGGRLATQHLIERGCRRIGTIAGPQDMSGGIDRLAGWRSAMARRRDGRRRRGATATSRMASGAAAARELLARYPDLDAIFIASDLMAAGALGVLAELGKDVPGDVAVVGYDNLGVAASTVPPLTTRDPARRRHGARRRRPPARAAATAHPRREPLIFAPELVIRASA